MVVTIAPHSLFDDLSGLFGPDKRCGMSGPLGDVVLDMLSVLARTWAVLRAVSFGGRGSPATSRRRGLGARVDDALLHRARCRGGSCSRSPCPMTGPPGLERCPYGPRGSGEDVLPVLSGRTSASACASGSVFSKDSKTTTSSRDFFGGMSGHVSGIPIGVKQMSR